MSSIKELQKFFLILDEGKGTAYERYATNKLIKRIVEAYKIKSVLELPANGVMGIPGLKSLLFAKLGCEVTLINPSKKAIDEMKQIWDLLELKATFIIGDYIKTDLPDNSFDLVWNFCVFEHFDNPSEVIKEMCRLSKGYIFLEIQNIFNLGIYIHSLYHKLTNEVWDHGSRKKMNYHDVAELIRANSMEIVKIGGCDMPPVPDLNMKIGEIKDEKQDFTLYGQDFRRLRPSVKLKEIEKIKQEWQQKAEETTYPWWMNVLIIWYYLIESCSPEWIRIFLSHHPYLIGKKNVYQMT